MAISPAPWTTRPRTTPTYVDIIAADGTRVGLVGPRGLGETTLDMDNAYLVAAAPDLLDAIEGMLSALRSGAATIGADGHASAPVQRLIDAAAKARGAT